MTTRNRIKKKLRQKIRETAFELLPECVSHKIIRNSLNLTLPQANSELKFEIVNNTNDLKHALELVQQNFEEEAYTTKNKSGLRLTPYHLLPNTIVIIAKNKNEDILATATIIPRTQFGVPLDAEFKTDTFLKGKGTVAEMSSLAVDKTRRGQRGEVLYNLIKFVYQCNANTLAVDFEVIGVNPKMVPFYKAVLLFKEIPGTTQKTYGFANGAPVIPMYFNLKTCIETYKKVYKDSPPHLNLTEFFESPPPSQFVILTLDDLDHTLPQRRAEDLKTILNWQPDIIRSLNQKKQEQLIKLYEKYPDCIDVLKQFKA